MATTIESLVNFIRSEIGRIRKAVNTFDFDENGRKRYLDALAGFARGVEDDLDLHKNFNMDVRDSLEARLRVIQDLPRAVRQAFDNAYRADWLALWIEESEQDCGDLLGTNLKMTPAARSRFLN
jgi:hypothetical protein